MAWLLQSVIGDQARLNSAQQEAVRARVKTLYAAEPLATLTSMIPGMLPLLMIPVWPRLANAWNVPWRLAFESVFAVCVLTLVYWLIRRRYRKYAFRAIRELGIADLCVHCGYDLSAWPNEPKRCAECGRLNIAMPRDGSAAAGIETTH